MRAARRQRAAARVAALCLVALNMAGGPVFAEPAAPPLPPGHAVASAHPLASRAGIEVLRAGGNAFDAAVAVSAALAVVEPTGSGIGGGGFWLLQQPALGHSVFIDGREVAPLAAHADMFLAADGSVDAQRARYSGLSAGIPGAPAAWAHIARRYGSLPLPRLLAPAIAYARDGFRVDAKLAAAIVDKQARFSPAAAAVFLPAGRPLGEGELLRQPELARTLEQLAEQGAPGFYEGEVAQRMVDGVRALGGVWSAVDLRRYRVIERAPLISWFRDYRIVSAPLPSAGGIALAQVLQQLEVLGWQGNDPVRGPHLVIEALRRAYRDRARYLGDPDFVFVPVTGLTSRSYARQLAASIRRDRATPSDALAAPPEQGTQTTHFSILDAKGNRVAATLSINLSFGSGLMVPGTGVLLNNEMDDFAASVTASNAYGLIGSRANAIAPGKRMLSSMTPTIVEGPRGLLITGTPGGSRIISMVLLSVLGFTEGLGVTELVALPRFHHQYLPDAVWHEPDAFAPATAAALRGMGHVLRPTSRSYGNMQAVLWEPDVGTLQAASDPRGVGAALVDHRTGPRASGRQEVLGRRMHGAAALTATP